MTSWLDLFPIAGTIFANALFFAPAPAVYDASRTGKLGSLNTLPLALMAVNSTVWFIYSIVLRDRYLAFGNGPGCVVSIWYVTTTLPLIPPELARQRKLVQQVLLSGASALLLLCATLGFAEYSRETQKFVFGLFGSFTCTLLFASPLSTAYQVIKTRDASTIYAPLTIAQVVNCVSWTVYGFVINNAWVFVPNGTGTTFGLIQLSLKMIFRSRMPPPEIRTLPMVLEVLATRESVPSRHGMELLPNDLVRNVDDVGQSTAIAFKPNTVDVALTDAVIHAMVETTNLPNTDEKIRASLMTKSVPNESDFTPLEVVSTPRLDEAARVLKEAMEPNDFVEKPLDLSGLHNKI